MLSPAKTKYRKKQRKSAGLTGQATRCNRVSFGDVGLMSLEAKWVTNRQIEAARIAMTRHVKRGGKVWIRIYPDMPYTKKPAETRMGKGKGNPEYWVAPVKPGTIMFEMSGVDTKLSHEAMLLAASKLPVKSRVVARRELG